MKRDMRQKTARIIKTHKAMTAAFEADGVDAVIAAAKAISKAIRGEHRIYICGNGGSAADAQHIAGELVGRFAMERKALPAAALTTDTSVITCIAIDYGYEDIFSRQVEALVCRGDVLWTISTSGTSANILSAARLAKQKGAVVLAFTGRKNSELEKIADINLCAENKSTARSQEIHQLAYHIICGLVEEKIFGK